MAQRQSLQTLLGYGGGFLVALLVVYLVKNHVLTKPPKADYKAFGLWIEGGAVSILFAQVVLNEITSGFMPGRNRNSSTGLRARDIGRMLFLVGGSLSVVLGYYIAISHFVVASSG